MPAAALPDNEDKRLEALSALHALNSGPDTRLDDFVKMAASLYNVPIALVTLIDRDRQWYKSAIGLDFRETPRSVSFCAHAILSPSDVLVVEDATRDPRFADNPMVNGDPYVRFYAGAVVTSPSGYPVGTLCLLDREPRTLDEVERKRLQDLAGAVSALLDLHRATTELRRAASHDQLTGLANRAQFDRRLDLAVTDALAGRPCALLLLDLDRFKEINDRLGPASGDAILREVAGRLNRLVLGGNLVARFGGDSFAVLMIGPANGVSASEMRTRITKALSVPMLVGGEFQSIRASIGTALCPLDATTPGALIRAAEQALFKAKRAAAGSVSKVPRLKGEEGDRTFVSGASITGRDFDTDLRRAVTTEELRLHWQPIYAAGDGKLRAYEALLRWDRPGHGPVPPGVFIPFAESSGLIEGMDAWTMQAACASAAKWPEDITVSVNLSAHWFGGAEVVDLVKGALSRFQITPHRLCIEITERTVIARRDVARAHIEALHELGVRVAMDDFGTGFSALAYLRDLPFDVIKLDRSFVSVLGASARCDAVACSIIDLGHRLGMTVCAEGVQTEAQLALLRQQGCDLVQGYLLGKPRPKPVAESIAPETLFPPVTRLSA